MCKHIVDKTYHISYSMGVKTVSDSKRYLQSHSVSFVNGDGAIQ